MLAQTPRQQTMLDAKSPVQPNCVGWSARLQECNACYDNALKSAAGQQKLEF